jgi:hypothetical protein
MVSQYQNKEIQIWAFKLIFTFQLLSDLVKLKYCLQ